MLTLSTWCQYPIYRTGYNKTSSSYPVYHTYYSGSAQSGTIYATEGETANSTLIVLCGYNNKYLIQYISNTSNNGSQQIKWKRGWVDPSAIALDTISEASGIDYTGTYYIQNVHTGKFLQVSNYNPVDGANTDIWDFHGGYNQEWQLLPSTDNGAHYVTFTTCQDTTKVLAVKNARAAKDVNIDLAVKGNPPSKDQEFYIVPASGYPGEYYIYSRLTGKCLQIGTNNTANGTSVYNRYPYVTPYNRWKLVPVYEEGVDYEYTSNGKIPSTVDYGIDAKYDISEIEELNDLNIYPGDFVTLTNNAFNAWERTDSRITLDSNQTSPNKIIWSELIKTDSNGPIPGTTSSNGNYVYNNQTGELLYSTKTITMYMGSIEQHCANSIEVFSEVWQSVLVHELGHTLGLGDIGAITTQNTHLHQSIMTYRYYITSVMVPSNAERAGVKKAYYEVH